jgi:opacity protein-like surface antigen
MQKIKYLISGILLLTTISFAQGLKIGPLVGYNNFTSPDAFTKSISDGGFGFSNNMQFGAKAKVDLILIKATAFVAYNSMSNDGEVQTLTGTAKSETEGSLLTIGLGAEFGLLPIPGPVKPYLGADLLINSFGDFKSTTTQNNFKSENTFSYGSRYGLGIGAGVEITAFPKVDLDLNVKYNFNNLIGKEDLQAGVIKISEESVNSITIQLTVLFKII